MIRGGVVLCGGESTRMGLPKLTLPFGPELMLQRVVRLLSEAVRPIVVVAAPGQDVPRLPEEVVLVRDEREGRGPLEGLAAGLRAIHDRADAVYVTGCDVPLLETAFVRQLFTLLGDLPAAHEIVVPKVDGFYHPLAAVYRTSVLGAVEQLLADGRMRPFFLFEEAKTRVVSAEALREVDPRLQTLRNLNRPEDYLSAIEALGFEVSAEVRATLGG